MIKRLQIPYKQLKFKVASSLAAPAWADSAARPCKVVNLLADSNSSGFDTYSLVQANFSALQTVLYFLIQLKIISRFRSVHYFRESCRNCKVISLETFSKHIFNKKLSLHNRSRCIVCKTNIRISTVHTFLLQDSTHPPCLCHLYPFADRNEAQTSETAAKILSW